jgi:anti-sigma factor RsiW
MNCNQARLLLHPYLDDELDVAQSMQVVEHLSQCPACDQNRAQIRRLSKILGQSDLRMTTPAALKERVQTSLMPSHRPLVVSDWQRRFILSAVAASLLAAVAFGIGRFGGPGQPSVELVADEVTTAHLRSLQVDHLVDVKSSDRHTVKPFFSGKLDFAAPVVELSDHGFELVGGRMDVLEVRPVAAYVYRKRKHVINVFVWPAPASETTHSAIQEQTSRGYSLLHWTGNGRVSWVISDLNPTELGEFAADFRQRMDAAAGT